ncbi:hypothetical protein ACQR1W_36520 [Bradyrhizobium sp. HKCCYLS1011]|uniref:hypothetical protein n=1 Tax=Bradyrhizobium sp. HKCCYLS1011 TaxID=3420733 RepID=UPI003EB8C0B8
MIMNPKDLVEVALVGLDRGEVLTLPTVADESVWAAYEAAAKVSKHPWPPDSLRPGIVNRQTWAAELQRLGKPTRLARPSVPKTA